MTFYEPCNDQVNLGCFPKGPGGECSVSGSCHVCAPAAQGNISVQTRNLGLQRLSPDAMSGHRDTQRCIFLAGRNIVTGIFHPFQSKSHPRRNMVPLSMAIYPLASLMRSFTYPNGPVILEKHSRDLPNFNYIPSKSCLLIRLYLLLTVFVNLLVTRECCHRSLSGIGLAAAGRCQCPRLRSVVTTRASAGAAGGKANTLEWSLTANQDRCYVIPKFRGPCPLTAEW